MFRFLTAFSKAALYTFCFLLISCSNPVDDSVLHTSFEPGLLQEDLDYLITTLEKRHVDFYQRANRDSIQRMAAKVRAQLTQPINRTEFFRVVGQLNPYFNDAHCLVFPLIEEADAKKAEGCKPFPFHVVLDEAGALRPERNYARKSDHVTVEKSWSLDSINGIATTEVLDRITRYSHGETPQLRRHMTTLLFGDWLFTLYGWCGEYNLVFNAGEKSVRITGADEWKSLEANVVQYNRLKILDDSTGYLRLNSFDVDEHEDAYETFIENAFDSLATRKTDKLIIDVRGNTGGQSDAGAQVLQYLTDKKLSQVSRAYDRIHEGNAGWFNYRGQPGQLKEMDLSTDDMIKPIEPSKRFRGTVVVLFDEMTYSAGIIFITIVQDHQLAITIGRPTGGFANQTGNIESFRLPHTQLTVYAPARKFVRPNGNTAVHAVTPDVVVTPPDSLVAGDYVLQRALAELRKGK